MPDGDVGFSLQSTLPPVYRLNANEWWAASSLEQAIAAASAHWSIPLEEVLDELHPPHRLSSDELCQQMVQQDGQPVALFMHLLQLHYQQSTFPRLLAFTP